jgi:hypothetical protein
MEISKKIIKADTLEKMGTRVETVDLEKRKYGDRVFKDAPVDENPVDMEEAVPNEPVSGEQEAAKPDTAEPEEQQEGAKLERFHDEEGALTGLRITCKCGEVIELEFTRD